MLTLKEQYQKEVAPALMKQLGVGNTMATPRIMKAVVNVGVSASNKDPKLAETVEQVLARITGQRPVSTKARIAIAGFKTRVGMVVGYMVTLRGKRMYQFVEKLIRITLPRVRDFRGIPITSVDERGNLSIGFREYTSFPEIRADEVERLHGIEVTIVTSAGSRERGVALFRALGMPFQK